MTRSELKSGMFVETRHGEQFLVLEIEGLLVLSNRDKMRYVGTYDEKLNSLWGGKEYDIVSVYSIPPTTIEGMLNPIRRKLLWQRKEEPKRIKEISMKELRCMFGCEVKIVEG